MIGDVAEHYDILGQKHHQAYWELTAAAESASVSTSTGLIMLSDGVNIDHANNAGLPFNNPLEMYLRHAGMSFRGNDPTGIGGIAVIDLTVNGANIGIPAFTALANGTIETSYANLLGVPGGLNLKQGDLLGVSCFILSFAAFAAPWTNVEARIVLGFQRY